MKKLLLFFFLLSTSVMAQDLPSSNPFPYNESGKIEFTGVVDTNLKADILYRNAKTWATTFALVKGKDRYYTPTIIMDDPTTGRIIVEYYYSVRIMSDLVISDSFKVTIDCKDGKYRYKIDDYIAVAKDRVAEKVTTFETLHNKYNNGEDIKYVQDSGNFFLYVADSLKQGMAVNDDF